LPKNGINRYFGKLLQGRTDNSPSLNKNDLKVIPGNELPSQLDAWWWLVGAIALLIIALAIMKPDPYWDIIKFVKDGILMTILLTIVSFVFILIAGIIGGMGRIAHNPILKFISTIYVEIFRGIPLLVQLIWWYFAAPVAIRSFGEWINFAPMANYQANAFVLAVAGLVICYGAYMSEIFRAGIQSIPKGQIEAARSQGMTYMQAMLYVVLPQALRVVLPPVGNEFIMLIKDTSLVSAVAMADLTRRGREYMASHFNPIETWTMVALIYLIMTLFFTRILVYLEKRKGY
jgi:polar amino acid transport system permease protein